MTLRKPLKIREDVEQIPQKSEFRESLEQFGRDRLMQGARTANAINLLRAPAVKAFEGAANGGFMGALGGLYQGFKDQGQAAGKGAFNLQQTVGNWWDAKKQLSSDKFTAGMSGKPLEQVQIENAPYGLAQTTQQQQPEQQQQQLPEQGRNYKVPEPSGLRDETTFRDQQRAVSQPSYQDRLLSALNERRSLRDTSYQDRLLSALNDRRSLRDIVARGDNATLIRNLSGLAERELTGDNLAEQQRLAGLSNIAQQQIKSQAELLKNQPTAMELTEEGRTASNFVDEQLLSLTQGDQAAANRTKIMMVDAGLPMTDKGVQDAYNVSNAFDTILNTFDDQSSKWYLPSFFEENADEMRGMRNPKRMKNIISDLITQIDDPEAKTITVKGKQFSRKVLEEDNPELFKRLETVKATGALDNFGPK